MPEALDNPLTREVVMTVPVSEYFPMVPSLAL
jgi:hypothetical protein